MLCKVIMVTGANSGIGKAAAILSGRDFGEDHDITRIARDFGAIFQDIIRPPFGYAPPGDQRIELIYGFDRSSVNCIQ